MSNKKKRDELKKKAELVNELKQNYEKLKAEYVTEKTAYMKGSVTTNG